MPHRPAPAANDGPHPRHDTPEAASTPLLRLVMSSDDPSPSDFDDLPPSPPKPAAGDTPISGLRVAAVAGLLLLVSGLAVALWPPDRGMALPADGPAPPPPFELAVDTEAGREPALARELARALVPPGAPVPALVSGAAGTAAPLAVMRYDQLQLLRRADPGAGLRIVAPLYLEEVQVLVHARSALRSAADLRGRRINTGPEDTSRAVTAQAVYARLFGEPLPLEATDTRPMDEALADLLSDGGVDAVVHVGAQPAGEGRALPPGLRRLPLRGTAATAPLQRTYLPTEVDGVPTVASMAFLVAMPSASDTLVADAARALCTQLPALRRDGDPKWRAVRPGLVFDTGWPVANRAGCPTPAP